VSKQNSLSVCLSVCVHFSSAIDRPPQLIYLCFYLQVFGVL
jgi:hypothetical protein